MLFLNLIVYLIFIVISIICIRKPFFVCSWKYNNAEPSDLAITYIRVSGFIGLIVSIIGIIFKVDILGFMQR